MEQSQLPVIEQQVKYHAELIEKMSTAIERLANASTDITKMLSVQEERYSQNVKNIELMYSVIQENKKEVQEIKKELKIDIDEIKKNINDVLKKTDIKMVYGIVSFTAAFCIFSFTGYQQYADFQLQTKYKIDQLKSK
jgi:ATP-dependent Clp protease ATP-binding subunit ClpA